MLHRVKGFRMSMNTAPVILPLSIARRMLSVNTVTASSVLYPFRKPYCNSNSSAYCSKHKDCYQSRNMAFDKAIILSWLSLCLPTTFAVGLTVVKWLELYS